MICSICGEYIRRWQIFNLDHHVPLARGGRRGKINKQPAHLLCNSVKGALYPFSLRTAEERALIRIRVKPRTYDRLERLWRGESA